MSLRARFAIVGSLLCLAPSASAQERAAAREGAPVARRVVDHTLADAAVAVADPLRPVIYVNPAVLARLGPAMASFVLAHEDAHIALNHLRTVGGVTDAVRLRRLELDADCRAARALAVREPATVIVAVSYFRGLGWTRVDEYHPSGAERAQRILECAAANGPDEALKPRPVRVDVGDAPGVR